MNRNQEPDPLGRSDYVAYWAQEARAHAATMNWPADRIPLVVEALEDVFGADWLRGKAPQPSRYPMTDDPKKHPVAHLISVPDLGSAMNLIELATYLRSCVNVPGFREVVKLLRAPEQFTTARMQLALAHRFRLAGAVDIELEPSADAGRKADIFFRYGEKSHLVECYEPAADQRTHHNDLLHGGVQRIHKAATEAGRRVVVRVDIHGDLDAIDGQMRKRIEQEAQYLIRKLMGPRTRQVKSLTDFEIEVIETSGVDATKEKELAFGLGKPGGWVIAPGMTDRRNVDQIPRGVDVKITRLGWFVINCEEPDPVKVMQRIAGAVEGKIAQVRRRAENVLGIMVVVTDFARLASRFKREAVPLVGALRNKVLSTHEGLAGVILIDHALHKERGPFIGGLFLQGADGSHLDGLHSAMASRETSRRVIDDWA